MLEYDLSADVRRAVLTSVAATTRTVAVILERTRDVKDVVRRLAYKVIAEKIHVRALTIAQRVRLLRQGLNDRTGDMLLCQPNFSPLVVHLGKKTAVFMHIPFKTCRLMLTYCCIVHY